VFALLGEYLKRKPARFEVEYHQTLGHATTAEIDISVNAADDELRFEIVELTLISGAALLSRSRRSQATLSHCEGAGASTSPVTCPRAAGATPASPTRV
jgi:hypothetical protein